jgi:hypothetical protein
MIKNITQTIENKIYGYDPTEFMPIRYDGEVANWDQFAIYKAEKIAQAVGHFAARSFEVTQNVAGLVFEHMMEESRA